jgi:EmrB/QacA subfamily drug resistance transporter
MRAGSYQRTFAVITVSTGAFALLQSLVGPVLATIQHSLHTNQNTVTWVMTAYLLAASVATPILGRVGDMFGKKKVFVLTMILLGLGALLSALATNITVMILGRVVQGAGGAVLPLSFGIIRDEFPREKVGSAVGIVAAMTAVGGGAGVALGGPIVDVLNYHWLFWLPMVVIFLAAGAAALLIPESPTRTPGKVNLVGAVLLSVWLITLLLGVSEGSSWGWTSVRVLGLFVAAVVFAVLWVLAEARSREPLVDMRMMRLRPVWTTNLVALMFGIGLYATMAFLPQFLQTPRSAGYGLGSSVTTAGLYLVPMTVTMFALGLITGRVAAAVGSRVAVIVGSLVGVVPLAMFALANDHSWEIILASAVFGIGLGLAFSAMANLIVESVPPAQTGVASGMNTNIRTIGGSIGSAVMAALVTSGTTADGLPRSSGYTHGFLFLAASSGLGAIIALLIPRSGNETVTLEQAGAHEHAEAALVAGANLVD